MLTLRTFRIAISSISFIAVSILFLDIANRIPSSWSSAIVAVQFGPAVIKTISTLSAALVSVVCIIVLTLLFGRVYCSHLCPLGTLQDIIIWGRKKKYQHRTFPYRKTNYLILYSVTAVIVITALSGSVVLLNLSEPFSNFGRILTTLVRPLIILANNAIAILVTSSNSIGISRIPLYGLDLWNIGFPLFFLFLIIGLTIWRGRLFCNLLCPVGGILSLLSRFSFYKIKVQRHECIDCGLCERVCKAQCINSETKEVDFAACIGCFDCVGSCPTEGMGYSFQRRSMPSSKESADRRTVLLSLSTALLSTTGIQNIADTTHTTSGYVAAKKMPVVPPGGTTLEHFESYCTACHLCVSSCPTHVLQPSFLEYGLAGLLQPRMDYNVSYCNYDCTICGEVCPTGAIHQLLQQDKKRVQLGKVTFVKEDCIVETKKKDCGACDEHCPTKAVKMIPYGTNLRIPQIENEYCVGCGACEHACPTTPRKAIYVTPNPVHLTAQKREEKRLDSQQATPQEFPF